MSNALQKSAIKMAVGIIGEDTIINGLHSFFQSLIERKKAIELEPGEADTIAIAYELNSQIVGAIATVNNERQICRIINPENLETLIFKMIKSM